MKSTTLAICFAFLLSCNNETKTADTTGPDSTGATVATKDSNPQTEAWIPIDDSTATKSMMEAGTPGQEQAMLAKDNGNWKAEISMWMTPGSEPMKSKGSISNKMIMDGRYQQMSFKGDMMGMAFEGSSTMGYDKARKVWVSTWVDNMSTGIMNMEGTWDDATKSLTSKGQMLCPANGKMCEMKQVMKRIDDKTQVMEMYGPDMKTGNQFKNMEIKMTRG